MYIHEWVYYSLKKGLQIFSEILSNSKDIFPMCFRYFLSSYLYNYDVTLNLCQYKNYNYLQSSAIYSFFQSV